MSRLAILRWPDPRLSAPCASVGAITPDIENLAQDMLETMYDAPGRGLAAPQVGVLKRVFVMDATWKDGAERAPVVFIDPEVLERSNDVATQNEGCLSLPGVTASVARAARVQVRWRDLSGADRTQWFDGFAAACVQHEIDHLDGVMTLDHLDETSRARVLKAYDEVTV